MRAVVLASVVTSMVCGVLAGTLAFWLSDNFAERRDERMLLTVVREVGDSYVDEVSRRELVDNAIKGVIEGLDDHSAYLDEDALLSMVEQNTGRFGGVGMELNLVDGYVTVVNPMGDGPAARAGIVAGDRVIEVDHQSLKGRTLTAAVQAIRGEPGTSVHLRIRRLGNDPEALDFDLTRDTITVPSAEGRLLSPGIGYIKVSQFNETTVDDLRESVAELNADGALAGLILDLRNNPGGLLDAAIGLADAFLGDGMIVATEGRAPEVDQRYDADADVIAAGLPLAVLINGGSASGAEVAAAALKYHGRATLLGTNSYGKESVQSVMHFKQRAVKITTARYVTPAGGSIQDSGVAPDIAVTRRDEEPPADYDRRLLEAAVRALQGRAHSAERT